MQRHLQIPQLRRWDGFDQACATAEIKVSVKGMVCGVCAQGIEKKFKAEPAVQKVEVSLENKLVTLDLKDGDMDIGA